MQPRWSDSDTQAAGRHAARVGTALVPSVSRALTLLERLAERREPMSLARLATDLALPKSSVHGLCSTLMSFGYLRRQTDGAFLIGPRVLSLAEAFVAGTSAAREFDALWRDAAAAPDETLVLSVLDGAEVVYVAVRHGSRPLGMAFNVGLRLPAHLAASGKAMLAFQPPDEVHRRYAGAPLAQLTRGGSASMAALLKELAAIRERGWSIDDEGVREGVYGLGAPVFGAGGAPVAGIGICTHKSGRARGAAAPPRRHLRTVLDAAATLTRRLGGEAPSKPVAPATRRRSA